MSSLGITWKKHGIAHVIGSRYDYLGKIITEPTVENLDTVNIE